jgi:hypothetical protein
MVVGSRAFILPNWTAKMQATPFLPHAGNPPTYFRYINGRVKPVRMATMPSCLPSASRPELFFAVRTITQQN